MSGEMTLHEAVSAGDVAKVQSMLADAPASVGSRNDFEETPLHVAVKGEHHEIAGILLAHGADVNAYSDFGLTPLSLAVAHRRLDTVRLLLEAGADPNLRIRSSVCWGETPLHLAALHASPDIVRLLLDRGADCAARTTRGETPLQLAQEQRREVGRSAPDKLSWRERRRYVHERRDLLDEVIMLLPKP